MSFFAARFLWRGFVRTIVFWSLFFGILAGLLWSCSFYFPDVFRLEQFQIVQNAFNEPDGVSSKTFVYALAGTLGLVASTFFLVFLILYAVLVPLSLRQAKSSIRKLSDEAAFARAHGNLDQNIKSHPLIGHAWAEFNETLVYPQTENGVFRNTVRPQAFFNIASLRERLSGLKWMGSIPGYFVGFGLLLTFIGLVLALNKAAGAINAPDADAMQKSMRELLQVATFKFATSIVGLGASIVLSIAFKAYTIVIESSLGEFCQVLEEKLSYVVPQSVALETQKILEDQLTELKQINSTDFFARMGESLSPQIQGAFQTAMAPVTSTLNEAITKLAENSQSGMADLTSSLADKFMGGAGSEMRELAGTLKAMQSGLMEAQKGIHGSGEDFGRRMSEAAETLNRLASEAGNRLNEGSEQSRAAFADIAAILRDTMEHAKAKVVEGLGNAAQGASERLEAAMGSTLARLEAQVDAFRSGLGGFQEGMARQMQDTQREVTAAQTSAVQAVASSSTEAAAALRQGLGEALKSITDEVERFSIAMRNTQMSLAAQASAMQDSTNQSRLMADAFSRTAQDVRTASAPLLQSGERIAASTDRLASSVSALEQGQIAAKALAEALVQHNDALSETWKSYAQRFAGLDESLAKSLETLAQATENQQQRLVEYVSQIDAGLAKAIDHLNQPLNDLANNTGEMSEAADKMARYLIPQAAE